MGAFYYVNNFFNTTFASESSTHVGRDFCAENWEDLQLRFPNTETEYLSNYCYGLSFLEALLHEIFGDNASEKTGISYRSMDWTVGAVIYELEHLSEDAHVRRSPAAQFRELLYFYIPIGIAFCVLAYWVYVYMPSEMRPSPHVSLRGHVQ